MKHALSLYYPEWQSSGESNAVYIGTKQLIEEFFDPSAFVQVDVPAEESLKTTDGVYGLHSIAPRFKSTLSTLQSKSPSTIFMVGGTCGVEVAPVAYLNEKYQGDLGVVWFDAHGDLNTPSTSPSGHFHGMALRTLLGDGPGDFTREIVRPLMPR